MTPEDLPAVLRRLDSELAQCGRDRSDFSISIAPAFGSFGPGLADRYRDLGVDRLIVPLAAFGPDDLDRALDALSAAGAAAAPAKPQSEVGAGLLEAGPSPSSE